ncbi:conserved hypothetical protein [Gammaproteobacteria bacterium]
MDFNHYCNLHRSDKGDLKPNGNCYAHWYDMWFSPIRSQVRRVCEIGVYDGASLRAFRDYFEQAQILGLDIRDRSVHDGERIKTRVLNQGDPGQVDQFVQECRSQSIGFDIILDDGSHDIAHQQLCFGKLFSLVNPGGYYVIEDLGSSYLTLGFKLYGQVHSQVKINNNTVQFLHQRPFASPWISDSDSDYINGNVDFVSIFDKLNESLTYAPMMPCVNNYPIRSITAVIRKRAA